MELTQEERSACAVVEGLVRRVNAAEVLFWRTPWWGGSTGNEYTVSVYLRTSGDLEEVPGLGLAAALERVPEVGGREPSDHGYDANGGPVEPPGSPETDQAASVAPEDGSGRAVQATPAESGASRQLDVSVLEGSVCGLQVAEEDRHG